MVLRHTGLGWGGYSVPLWRDAVRICTSVSLGSRPGTIGRGILSPFWRVLRVRSQHSQQGSAANYGVTQNDTQADIQRTCGGLD